MSVSRATLAELERRFRLPRDSAEALSRLLEGLAAEADPHTAIRDPGQAVERHLADSLTGLEVPSVAAVERLADIGAGAGFPGLALAIALPRARIDLVEASRRKCEVIDRLAAAAELANARPIHARVEEWGAAEGRGAYEVVTARALASLPVVLEYAAPLLRERGVLVAWKGVRDEQEELAGARAAERLAMAPEGVLRVTPFADARDRHLHVFRKVGPTPARFPRRAGAAAKRPLA